MIGFCAAGRVLLGCNVADLLKPDPVEVLPRQQGDSGPVKAVGAEVTRATGRAVASRRYEPEPTRPAGQLPQLPWGDLYGDSVRPPCGGRQGWRVGHCVGCERRVEHCRMCRTQAIAQLGKMGLRCPVPAGLRLEHSQLFLLNRGRRTTRRRVRGACGHRGRPIDGRLDGRVWADRHRRAAGPGRRGRADGAVTAPAGERDDEAGAMKCLGHGCCGDAGRRRPR